MIPVSLFGSTPSHGPNALLAEADFDFGRVLRGSQIEHEYRIRNEGPGPLRVGSPRLTPPLTCARLPLQIPPGEESGILLSLDTSQLMGPFEGKAVFSLNDPAHPEARLTLRGLVLPPIELVPLPAFFVAARRGQPREQPIEIINHEQQSLEILRVEYPEYRFTTRLETLEAGKVYRLTFAIKPDGPGGKHNGTIELHTPNDDVPIVRIPVKYIPQGDGLYSSGPDRSRRASNEPPAEGSAGSGKAGLDSHTLPGRWLEFRSTADERRPHISSRLGARYEREPLSVIH